MGIDIDSLPDPDEPWIDSLVGEGSAQSTLSQVIKDMSENQKRLADQFKIPDSVLAAFRPPSMPEIQTIAIPPRPEIGLLKELRDHQADQSSAMSQMSAGIATLASHAEAAALRGESEALKTTRLNALTILIAVLTGAGLGVGITALILH
jgi:hypothetical protein